ncbi:acetylornithine deacetylase [Glutamicibacter protophormiae]|uniref:Acetylornithine deacetylase n=2 Tax=Glutamicibacter protophormiae TaxID=37930 RepID=A0ABS4XSM7_GLUPR|nr:acetylornithine deacetylase [Glutamicibacter protophormiae]MBP2399516.1 acetylornithine deacetylase [Glutamicibacter protophormiae]
MSMPTGRSIELITELIAVDTTSRDSNLPLIELIEDQLTEHGIESVKIPSPDGLKANLLTTIPAVDGSRTGGIVLSGHTDVVPVDGQAWRSEPFAAQVRDGKLYGRGSCDMKGYLGVILAKLPELTAAELSEPIHLAFSYDEEIGCVGAVSLVERIVEQGLAPRGCFVGEPSSMRAIRGHKSMNVFKVSFAGVAAHSSLPSEGLNAISYALRFASFVEGVARELASTGPRDKSFIEPTTTMNVNRFDGGIAVNTIPSSCVVFFEYRSLAQVDREALTERFRVEAERLETEMVRRNPAASVSFEQQAGAPGLETAPGEDIVGLAAACGAIATDEKVTYGTEAGLFSSAGIPTVVCGPGDIAQAHAPDEFIELDQIAACERFIDQLMIQLSTS